MSAQRLPCAPVALFVYRRPDLLEKVLADLLANAQISETPLYIFSDAAPTAGDAAAVDRVRALCDDIDGIAELHLVYRARNLGCAGNVIDGVGRVLANHPAVIVLEDDVRVSPHFLGFMNRALACYRDRKDVFSVSGFSMPAEVLGLPDGYPFDVYLSRRNASHGWATWRDPWKQVDWQVQDYWRFRWNWWRRRRFNRGGNDLSWMLDAQMAGDIDSWAIRFSYAHFLHDAYAVFPVRSYTSHIGNDGSGTHVREGAGYPIDRGLAKAEPELPRDLQPDPQVLRLLRRVHSERGLSAWLGAVPGVRRTIRRLKRHFGIKRPLL